MVKRLGPSSLKLVLCGILILLVSSLQLGGANSKGGDVIEEVVFFWDLPNEYRFPKPDPSCYSSELKTLDSVVPSALPEKTIDSNSISLSKKTSPQLRASRSQHQRPSGEKLLDEIGTQSNGFDNRKSNKPGDLEKPSKASNLFKKVSRLISVKRFQPSNSEKQFLETSRVLDEACYSANKEAKPVVKSVQASIQEEKEILLKEQGNPKLKSELYTYYDSPKKRWPEFGSENFLRALDKRWRFLVDDYAQFTSKVNLIVEYFLKDKTLGSKLNQSFEGWMEVFGRMSCPGSQHPINPRLTISIYLTLSNLRENLKDPSKLAMVEKFMSLLEKKFLSKDEDLSFEKAAMEIPGAQEIVFPEKGIGTYMDSVQKFQDYIEFDIKLKKAFENLAYLDVDSVPKYVIRLLLMVAADRPHSVQTKVASLVLLTYIANRDEFLPLTDSNPVKIRLVKIARELGFKYSFWEDEYALTERKIKFQVRRYLQSRNIGWVDEKEVSDLGSGDSKYLRQKDFQVKQPPTPPPPITYVPPVYLGQ